MKLYRAYTDSLKGTTYYQRISDGAWIPNDSKNTDYIQLQDDLDQLGSDIVDVIA